MKQIAFTAPSPMAAAPMAVDSQRYLRQQAMSEALLGQGREQPRNWGDAIGKLAQQAAGLYQGNKAEAGKAAATQARLEAMRAAIGSDDPLSALAQSGDPDLVGMGLQAQMAKLLKDPGETYSTLTEEEERAAGLDPAGTYQRSSAGKVDVLSQPKSPEAPTVKDFFEGGQVVQKQFDPATGEWKEVGRGGRWQPQQAPQPPGPSDRAKRAQEAGLVPGTKEFQDFVLASETPNQQKPENILRDEFNALTKDFRTVSDAYTKIQGTSDTGAGDMSLLYSYVKLLDPGSVVRESEFATAAASGSFGEQVQGAVQRVMTGERLPATLRDAFKAEAKNIYNSQKVNFESVKSVYTDIAKRSQADPENVIWDYAPQPETQVDLGTGAPTGGDIYQQKYGIVPKGTGYGR